MTDAIFILAFLKLPGVGRKNAHKFYSFLRKNELTLKKNSDFDQAISEFTESDLRWSKDDVSKALINSEKIMEDCARLNIEVLFINDPTFPESLKYIPNPPIILYAKGNTSCLTNTKTVAIIGTRAPTAYGKKAARRLGTVFSEKGFVVISGLAKGCDAEAHQGCVSAKGKGIAVLAEGLDKISPASNRFLGEEILKNSGCLISEYHPGQRPFKTFFVERDRLQSGLSLGVIVVETGERGGTMHTVGFAIEQKRPIACLTHTTRYALNESIQGNLMLLKSGKATALGSKNEIDCFIEKILSNQDLSKINPHSTNCNDTTEFNF